MALVGIELETLVSESDALTTFFIKPDVRKIYILLFLAMYIIS